MKTKTGYVVLGIIILIVAIILIVTPKKDFVENQQQTLNEQINLEGIQDDENSSEDGVPSGIPPSDSTPVGGEEEIPSFPKTGFPETE